jgi:hypothetical protein
MARVGFEPTIPVAEDSTCLRQQVAYGESEHELSFDLWHNDAYQSGTESNAITISAEDRLIWM